MTAMRTSRVPRRTFRMPGWVLLVAPVLAILLALYVLPVASIFTESFLVDGKVSLGNYTGFFGTEQYVGILLRTFLFALVATLLCGVLAYPYAFLLTRVTGRLKIVLVALVLVPFWTSMLARTYAWLVLLQDNGPVQAFLQSLGITVPLLRSPAGVLIGMVQILLPFMVLPLYNTMSGIDRRLLHAAETLGANKLKAFVKVYFPLSLPGLMSGGIIVYVLSLGFYVTPAILGSPQTSLLSQLIVQEISQRLDWGSAGAMSVILVVLTLAFLALAARFLNLRSIFSNSEGDR
ncbi:ABC transporter permease [Leucobacter muris]|uniref:ABC transporter permease n=2 Tax=Leucobacter muris TaxID=1935379 RepID=A0ABX5QCR4_9MICO|nr:ABC transporter permease [Leucobacter muris]